VGGVADGASGAAGACRDRPKARQRGRLRLRMASPSVLYRPCGAGRGAVPKRCGHPNRALPLGPGHHTTRPPWPEAALFVHLARHRRTVELSCSDHCDMNRPAPNSGPYSWRGPRWLMRPLRGMPPSALWLALINELVPSVRHAARAIRAVQHTSTWWWLHRGGGARRSPPSAGDIGGHGGEGRYTVRRRCNQRVDPNKDVRHARPVQCDGNYHGAAHRFAIVRAVIYHSGDPHRRLPECGDGPNPCHGWI